MPLESAIKKLRKLKPNDKEKAVLIIVPWILGVVAYGICVGQNELSTANGFMLPLDFSWGIFKLLIKSICNMLHLTVEIVDCICPDNDHCLDDIVSYRPNFAALVMVLAWIYTITVSWLAGSLIKSRVASMRGRRGVSSAQESVASAFKKAKKSVNSALKKLKIKLKGVDWKKHKNLLWLIPVFAVVFCLAFGIYICKVKDCSYLKLSGTPLTQKMKNMFVAPSWFKFPSFDYKRWIPSSTKLFGGGSGESLGLKGSWSGSGSGQTSNAVAELFPKVATKNKEWSLIPKSASTKYRWYVPTIKLQKFVLPSVYLSVIKLKPINLGFSWWIPAAILSIPLLVLLIFLLTRCIISIKSKRGQQSLLGINSEGKWEYGASKKKMDLKQKTET